MTKYVFLGVTAATLFTSGFAFAASHVQEFTIQMNRAEGSCAPFSQNLLSDSAQNIICVVAGSGGHFQGGGEFGTVFRDATNTWIFKGNSCQPGVFFKIECFR
jgi:hypothetical protein